MADDLTLRIGGSAKGVLDAVGQTVGAFKGLSIGLQAAIAAPMLAIGGIALKAANDAKEAQNTIRIATGATGTALEALMGTFRRVYAEVPDSAATVAKAIGDLSTRTGASGERLEKLATQTLNLARIHKLELGPLIAATTRLFGDWSVATENQADTLDYLHKTSQTTGIGVTRLTELMVQFGAPLRSLGYSFEEGAALMGKWEKEGVNLETVLSGLRFALAKFAAAGEDPRTAMARVVDQIKNAKTESEATGIAFSTFGKRAAVDMGRAILEGRLNIDDLLKTLRSSRETVNKAEEDTKTLGERFIELRHGVEGALVPLGNQFLGVLTSLTPIAKGLAAVVADVGVAAGTAARTIIETWQGLPTWFREVAKTAGEVALAVWAAHAAFVALSGSALFAGIGRLAGGIKELWLMTAAFGASGFAVTIGSWLAPLGAVWAGVVKAATGFVMLGTGMTGAAAAAAGVAVALGAIAVVVGSVTAVLYAGSIAWDLYKQHKQKAVDDAQQVAQDQRAMAEATKIAGRTITDAAEAYKILNTEAARLRGTHQTTKPAVEGLAAVQKTLADSIAKVRAEVDGLTSAERAQILKAVEVGISTTDIAKAMGISSEAIELVKKAHEGALDAAKKATEEHKKLAEELFKLGVVSEETGSQKLQELLKPLKLLGDQHTPQFQRALITMLPELEHLQTLAKESGVTVWGLGEAIRWSRQAAEDSAIPFINWERSLPIVPIGDLIKGLKTTTGEQEVLATRTARLTEVYHQFGLKTPAELQKVAREAKDAYETLRASGTASTEDLKTAYQAMIDAQNAATRTVPSLWKTEVFPKVKGVIETLSTAINGSFAQMLLGAKGFKDGFVDIWNSIKAALGNVLNQILQTFTNQFLKGLLAAMQGKKGALSSAFSGLFSGAGGNGAGAAAGQIGPVMQNGQFVSNGGGFGAGAAVGGAGIGVGSYMAGSGYTTALNSKNKGALAGAATGAATGAAIGSVIPGLGTVIGGVIGGVGGLIGGLMGTTAATKANRAADQELQAIQADLLKVYGTVANIKALGPAGAELAAAWGDRGVRGLENFKGKVSDLNTQLQKQAALQQDIATTQGALADLTALQAQKGSWSDVQSVAEKYGITLDQMGPKIQGLKTTEEATQMINDFNMMQKAGVDTGGMLEGMKEEISALVNESVKYGTALPENMKPVVQALFDQGQLVDANGAKFKDLTGLKFGAPVVTEADKIATAIETLTTNLQAMLDKMAAMTGTASTAATGVQDAFDGVEITIPVNYETSGLDGAPAPIEGAAGGVFARRPLLRVFGEGGEPELGGPVSFMKTALAGALAEVGLAYQSVGGGKVIGPALSGLFGAPSDRQGPPIVHVAVDASGAWFENDQAVDDLAKKIGQTFSDRYLQFAAVPL